MEIVKIGGVPEHFNMPWNLAYEEGLFKKQNIDLDWKDYLGGTGALCADLRNGTLDLAVVLTEGLIADIIKGNPAQIIQWHVTTPLNWGIHVSANSPYQNLEELEGKRYAISRIGSGSHLMAYVDAAKRNWTLKEDQFVTVGNLSGALDALQNNKAEIFLWEKLMTKPYVDKGFLRRVGECPTPWPSFALAGRKEYLEKNPEIIQKIMEVTKGFESRMRVPDVPSLLVVEYGFLEDDVATWLQQTHWSDGADISSAELENTMQILADLKLITGKVSPAQLVSSFTKLY